MGAKGFSDLGEVFRCSFRRPPGDPAEHPAAREKNKINLLYPGTLFTVTEQNVFTNELGCPMRSSVILFEAQMGAHRRRMRVRTILNKREVVTLACGNNFLN